MNLLYPGALPIAMSLTAYNAFLTGFIVLLKRKDRAGIYYFISSFLIFIWGVGISFMLHNQLPDGLAKSWGAFSQVVALFIPSVWLQFVLVYTGKEFRYKRQLVLVYLMTAIIFLFAFSRYFVAGFREMVGISRYPIPGPAYLCFALLFSAVVLFSFWIFFERISEEQTGSEKKQDYIFVCLASMYGFGTGSLSFLPVFGIAFPQYNLLLMPMWQILLAYAMIRHRAFDLGELAAAAQRNKLAAIGTLAASINHEIRNPLYVIKGLAGTFIANVEDGVYLTSQQGIEKAKTIMFKIEEQTGRAMDIMKTFALFAKRSEHVESRSSESSLIEILNNVRYLVVNEIEFEKIELILDVPADLPNVYLNIRQGEEIFFNLIVNACQAFKSQSDNLNPQIWISAKAINAVVSIEVKDNGPGIPSKQLKQIFEPFYTTKDQGTGLGLYITKELVHKNMGKIMVDSLKGKGATFKLKFKSISRHVDINKANSFKQEDLK